MVNRHGPGQRVSEKIEFAKALLEEYGYVVFAPKNSDADAVLSRSTLDSSSYIAGLAGLN